MTKLRCRSCGGIYNPDQPGGYYHTCPPYRLVRVGPGGPNIEPGDPGPYEDVTKIPQYEVILDPRDENLDDTIREKPRRKREGKGVEPVVE